MLKLASIRGVTDKELAEDYQIAETAIRKKRSRDAGWAAIVSQKRASMTQRAVTAQSQEAVETLKNSVDRSLETIAQENPLLIARFAHEKLKETVKQDLVGAPTNWQEVKTATDLIRKATGLDKEQGQVTLNLWGGLLQSGGPRDVTDSAS